MAENKPAESGTGGAYTDGPDPYPGGEIDPGRSLIPPYEGRTDGTEDTETAPPVVEPEPTV